MTSQSEDQGMDQLLNAAATASDLNERSRLISEAAALHLAAGAPLAEAPIAGELSVPALESVIDDFLGD